MIEIKRFGKNLLANLESLRQYPYQSWWWGLSCDASGNKIYLNQKSDNRRSGFYTFLRVKPTDYSLSVRVIRNYDDSNIVIWFRDSPVYQTYSSATTSFKTGIKTLFMSNTSGGIVLGIGGYGEVEVSLVEGNSNEFVVYNFISTEIDDEIYGFNGTYDYIDNGIIVKFWQRTTKTTDASGNFTLSGYASGSKVIVVNNSNGETKTYDAASTITTPWANAEVMVIYCQSSPTLIELPEHGLKTDDDVNYFDIVSSVKDTYVGDGTTTTFTLSQTADSSYYQVYVNGEVDNSVSRTTTQFTFSEPPKNGALIEVYYNRYYLPTPMSVEVFEPSGTVEQLTFFTNLSINIQQNVRQVRDVFGDVEVKKLNETYQVRLDRNILENIDDFYQQYKDKTFRLKIENSSTGEAEYLTPCKIVNANKDYFGRLESITIMALDYYKA